MTVAAVNLWGRRIGGVSLNDPGETAVFEYDPTFAASTPVEVSPIMMPTRDAPFSFPGLAAESFRGLPGLLADSLPDRFGNALIDAWLAQQGRSPDEFDSVERLCYIGSRGMGALEFEPTLGVNPSANSDISISALVDLASKILARRGDLEVSLKQPDALADILSVGTSAGGARAKAVIAWNPSTGAVRSGQVDAAPGFEHWILKFDGVRGNRDRELDDPQGYGAIEYAYSLMAGAAGIEMAECRLLEEGGRRHFMSRRFDRIENRKIHMQSLAALGHFDFRQPGAYSYEQALLVIRRLGLSMQAVEQQFRRMVFNVVARNQDDHVKNIAFLMRQSGDWALSPAFDVTYAFNPDGTWTSRHQMTVNGKTDDFRLEDFQAVAEAASMKKGRAQTIYREVVDAISRWPEFASDAKVHESQVEQISGTLRLGLS